MDTVLAEKILAETVASYGHDPIDLLDLNDGEGEHRYLVNAYASYLRTIADIVAIRASSTEMKVLELGAYLGPVSITLAKLGFTVTAADLPIFMGNPRLAARFRQNGVNTMALDLQDYLIPAPDAAFDLVVICETIEHLNFNPLPVLAEINRVLKDGGVLYVSLPNLVSLVNRAKFLIGRSVFNPIEDFASQLRCHGNMIAGIHWREYSREELVQMLTLTGFDVTKHYFFTNTRSHPLARLLYRVIPQLRPNQTAIAAKTALPEACFLAGSNRQAGSNG